MSNSLEFTTTQGVKSFYLFEVSAMQRCAPRKHVNAEFTAHLQYIQPENEQDKSVPSALIGVTQMKDDSLLPVYVLHEVEAQIKDAFCNKKRILIWVAKDQGMNITTIEGVLELSGTIESKHIDYYAKSFHNAEY